MNEQREALLRKPAEVFISYQHDKQKQILALYKKLMSLGYTCWIDKNEIQGGKVLLEEISKGLRGCKVVLCCLTQKYTESKACRQEIQLANAINQPIIPLKLERELQYPPPGPMDLILAELTYIDFYKPNDSIQNNWNCPQFDELKQQIDVLLNKSQSEGKRAQTKDKEMEAQDDQKKSRVWSSSFVQCWKRCCFTKVAPERVSSSAVAVTSDTARIGSIGSFKVVPVSAQQLREANNNHRQLEPNTDESGLPSPSPHKKLKDQLFKSSDYSKLDSRACDVPQDLYRNRLSELVEYLVAGTKTELERVRVVYRWITAQDLSQLPLSDNASISERPETVHEYLSALKNGYISYHEMMAEMCRCVSVVTKEITGYVKLAKYEPGDELTDNDKGSWTAVLIDSAWFLTDVLLGSQKKTGIKSICTLVAHHGEGANNAKGGEVETEHYDYDEYYFLVNPEELIFSHFPLDQNWQLLSRKVTLEEFRQFVSVKPQFFQSKLELVYPSTSVVNVPDGVIDVNVKYPTDSSCQFAYRLWLANDQDVDLSDTHNDLHLKDFVFMQSREGNLSFHIEFPTPGKFKLEVFCTNTVADSFYPACSFTMVAKNAKKDAKPLPSNDFAAWGPTQRVEALGMKPLTHTNGHVKAKGGEAELRFTAPAAEITVLPTLHSDNLTDEELEKNVIHRIEDDQVIINVRVPDKGDYVLDIYAKEKGTDKEGSIPHVCSYLISADTPAANPAGFPDQLGPLASNKTNLKLTALSHPTSIFRAPLQGEAVMTFGVYCTSASFTLQTELGLCKQNELVSCNEFTYVSTQSRKSGGGGTATIRARFPETGTYNLKIYGRESDSDSRSSCLVYSYEIYVSRAMENCSPFPVTMVGWDDESCEMIQPRIDQPLLANTTVPFRVKILKAGGVFVQSSDDGVQTTLSRAADDEAGVWTGEVATGNAENCLTLFANFNRNSRSSYNGLLEFKVIPFRNTPVPVVGESKTADNLSTLSESENVEGDEKLDTSREITTAIDENSKEEQHSDVIKGDEESGSIDEDKEFGHKKPDKVPGSGAAVVERQDEGEEDEAEERLEVETGTTSQNGMDYEREETEAEKNTTSKTADEEEAEFQSRISDADSETGERSIQVNPVEDDNLKGEETFEGAEKSGNNTDGVGDEKGVAKDRTEKAETPSSGSEVKQTNSSVNRKSRETTSNKISKNRSKRATEPETFQTNTGKDYKTHSKRPATKSDSQKRSSGGLSKSGPADVNSSKSRSRGTRRDETDDDLLRRKEEEERAEKELRWKSKFTEEEERKKMGERGYQVQRHKALHPKLKEFNDKVKEMNKTTKK